MMARRRCTPRCKWGYALISIICISAMAGCVKRSRPRRVPAPGIYRFGASAVIPECDLGCEIARSADAGWRCICPSQPDAGAAGDGGTSESVK